ncbi:MAG: mechanosensitive ion channel family protein [Chloroflexi bacterium]|nr:mechanosensitive ion channel family protein [Chloroflexota bacterium]
MQEYLTTLAENFVNSIPNLVAAILILIISIYGGVLLSRILRRVLERNNAEPGITHLLTRTLRWTIILLGIIASLQRFFNVTAFLTGLGIIGFTVGFAMQNIMQNFVSGVILLVQQPFRVGHSVGIAGFDGTVLKIGLRTTEIKALDGRIVFLPNADVLAQPIVNYTRADLRRVELSIGVAFDSNPDVVRMVILDELKNITGFLNSPEPQVLFHTFGASSIDLNVFFWVDTSITSPLIAKDEALTLIKNAFEKKKIEIPYPIQMQIDRKTSTSKRKTK